MAVLTLYNGGLLLAEGGGLQLSDSVSEPCCCDAEACDVLRIIYDWSDTGQNDLDTGTTFLGNKVGWSCGNNSSYISWGGDNTGTSGIEYADVFFRAAFQAGLWTGSVTVSLAAGWYSGNSGSGPATVRVRCQNDTSGTTEKSKTISPGRQNVCANTNVGSVTIYENGSFDLN